MNIEEIRDYCLAKPAVTEGFPFGGDTLVFKVMNKMYALVGLDNGTAFVDVTDTDSLVYLGKLPTETSASPWRDIKVYQDHAFIGSEAGGHGMQVFDLTRLRSVDNPPVSFTTDAVYTGFGNSHNIVINEATGYAYPVGTARNDAFNGGIVVLRTL